MEEEKKEELEEEKEETEEPETETKEETETPREEKPGASTYTREKPEFKTLKKFEKTYGRYFVEIALKEIEEGNRFISFAKGVMDMRGNKRYRKAFGVPNTEEMKKFILEAVEAI